MPFAMNRHSSVHVQIASVLFTWLAAEPPVLLLVTLETQAYGVLRHFADDCACPAAFLLFVGVALYCYSYCVVGWIYMDQSASSADDRSWS